jgi:hypothetical protein
MPEANLSTLSRDKLLAIANRSLAGVQSARRSLKRFKDAAADPVMQSGEIIAGGAGAALSGVIAGITPASHRFQYYDSVLGGVVALASLLGAGSYGGDMAASMGIGLFSPGVSRAVADKVRQHRAK